MKEKPVIIYHWSVKYNNWTFGLAATGQGLCRVLQPHEPLQVLEHWAARNFPASLLVRDEHRLTPYAAQFEEYFTGSRKIFDLPLDLHGTAFQLSVWKALLQIPYGITKTYSEIASQISRPAAVRAVGAANGANPIPIVAPCHRVIGKNGLLTGYRGGLEVKKELLALEGITGISS